jgi:hypothetical protein
MNCTLHSRGVGAPGRTPTRPLNSRDRSRQYGPAGAVAIDRNHGGTIRELLGNGRRAGSVDFSR